MDIPVARPMIFQNVRELWIVIVMENSWPPMNALFAHVVSINKIGFGERKKERQYDCCRV
jgi:hypothetical protein